MFSCTHLLREPHGKQGRQYAAAVRKVYDMPWPVPLPVCLLCNAVAKKLKDLVDSGSSTSLGDVLEEGIRELQEHGAWKSWEYEGVKFYDVEIFWQHMREHHLDKNLVQLLPNDDPKGPKKPAEAAFRQRMCNLLRLAQDGVGLEAYMDMSTKHWSEVRQELRQLVLPPAEEYEKIQMISTILSALEQVSESSWRSMA